MSRAYGLESIEYLSLADRIRAGDTGATEELYALVRDSVRFLLVNRLDPTEVDDVLHDVFVAGMQAVRADAIRNHACFAAYLRGIAWHILGHLCQSKRRCRPEPVGPDEFPCRHGNPEEVVAERQRVEFLKRILLALSPKEREVLKRYYLHGESQETICNAMDLTATQFRLLKSRAKARLVEKCSRVITRSRPQSDGAPRRPAAGRGARTDGTGI